MSWTPSTLTRMRLTPERLKSLLPEWLPGGRIDNGLYLCAGFRGGPGDVLSVNLADGTWRTPDHAGPDPITLYAAIEQLDLPEAERRLFPLASDVLESLRAQPGKPFVLISTSSAAPAAATLLGASYVVLPLDSLLTASWDDLTALYGRPALLWPTCGHEPESVMETFGALLVHRCPEVKLIDPTGQADGWDAACALRDGWNAQTLIDWAKPRVRRLDAARPPTTVAVTVTQDSLPAPERSHLILWEELGIACSKQGLPACNADNVLRALERYAPLSNLIWFDTFHQRHFTQAPDGTSREWTDADTSSLLIRFQRELGLSRMSKDALWDGLVTYGLAHARNDPRDWLKTLNWDSIPRIHQAFTLGFGAPATPYVESASKNFWIGLCARLIKPGCQLDNMVVLEGKQGVGKTRALRIIGGPWYAEAHESVTNKDFFMGLSGKFLIEIAELDSFTRAEVTRIKQVVSCPSDRFRAPYGRQAQDHPRQCIFVGTTNEAGYLRDPTGARRFWPIPCGQIDLAWLKESRNQLFAEAKACYAKNATWYEMPLADTLDQQESRRHHDSWEDLIEDFILQKDSVSLVEVLMEGLHIEAGRISRSDELRAGAVLRLLGWEKRVSRSGNKLSKRWFRKEVGEDG